MNKHQKILSYIERLPVGSQISVRSISKNLNVSDGTAYRAIKDAEAKGFVSTVPRIGTIRIESPKRTYEQKVTFAELASAVDGTVLGGKEGLHKTLKRFLIGAMELEEMAEYISEGSLLIVGNRYNAHKLALEKGAAVLISGGFDTNEENKKLADELELPLIKSPYDTYTTATLINRTLYDHDVRKDILLVQDVMNKTPYYLNVKDSIEDWKQMFEDTNYTRFPVVDDDMKVRGVITSVDITNKRNMESKVDKIMTKNPLTTSPRTLVASIAHLMVWEGVELVPVVDEGDLVGVITRTDVMKALQFGPKGTKVQSSYWDIVLDNFTYEKHKDGITFKGEVTSVMLDQMGGLNSGVFNTIILAAAHAALRNDNDYEVVPENFTLYYLQPVQLNEEIEVRARIIEKTRNAGKVGVEIVHNDYYVASALFAAKILKSSK
ncbi:DRTGG domain-containing protein [Natranaerofaba carboxydovora]|uniref:DRTGG domain-containing protein n=1 Tax=Natranaerofaba carboxydovora TaxID=2742683 RepID=UPI001F13325A|nr:DRTGG domain-containing protein [Natranaerofaba carboxydovora]UMZ74497.1 Cobalt-dependent inorganic pyrophosphatase [Natranaerofaba carboxydovora]